MRLVVVGLIVVCAVASAATAAPDPATGPDQHAANQTPRLVGVTARIGRVYEEGRGWKQGGLQLRYGVCDDGPQNTSRRWALLRITHKWRDASGKLRPRKETVPLITYDIHFAKRECARRLTYDSIVPTELASLTCYSVAVRVRDPGRKWSKSVERDVLDCSDDSPPVSQPSPQPSPPSQPSAPQPLVPQPAPAPTPGNCDPSYPGVCIPPPPPDLDCADVPYTQFTVLPPDPHGFDGNQDGVGCEL